MSDGEGYPTFRCKRCTDCVVSFTLGVHKFGALGSFVSPVTFSVGALRRTVIHECDDGGRGLAELVGLTPVAAVETFRAKRGGDPLKRHDHLVLLSVKLLRTRGCSVILTEARCRDNTESPDAIGWALPSCSSVVIECKTSKKDFLDEWRRRKTFRHVPSLGMGTFRYYVARTGVLSKLPVEQLQGWGLIEVYPGGSLVERHTSAQFMSNRKTEMRLLVQALSRSAPRANPDVQLAFQW